MRSATIGSVGFSLLLSTTAVYADSITIQGKVTNQHLHITVDIKDKEGKPKTVDAIVDPGNNDGVGMNAATAAALGLPSGPAATANGAGGSISTPTVSIPASNVGTPKNTTGTISAPVQGPGPILPGLSDNQFLLGYDFLNPDSAGAGSSSINYSKGTLTIYNHAQALKLASLELDTTMETVASGSLDTDIDPDLPGDFRTT
jgi:Aspartyl protease